MSGIATAVVASAVIGGVVASKSAGDAADAQVEASEEGIAEQRAARESFEERAQPFVDLGTGAAGDLQSFLDNPMQQLDEINPLVNFLRDQGFESIQESAAASGRLGAGGTLKDLTSFNTNLASTIVPQLQNQRFNQLFNTAGLGSNAASGVGTAGMNAASNIGNLQAQSGAAQASGIMGQSNALTGAISNVAGAAGAFPNLFSSGTVPASNVALPNAGVTSPAQFSAPTF